MAETAMSVPQRRRKMRLRIQSLPGEINMTKTHFWMITLLMTVVITGCEDRNQPAGSSSSATSNPPARSTAAPPAANNVTDQWLGKWIGPEGTYLILSKNADKC